MIEARIGIGAAHAFNKGVVPRVAGAGAASDVV